MKFNLFPSSCNCLHRFIYCLGFKSGFSSASPYIPIHGILAIFTTLITWNETDTTLVITMRVHWSQIIFSAISGVGCSGHALCLCQWPIYLLCLRWLCSSSVTQIPLVPCISAPLEPALGFMTLCNVCTDHIWQLFVIIVTPTSLIFLSSGGPSLPSLLFAGHQLSCLQQWLQLTGQRRLWCTPLRLWLMNHVAFDGLSSYNRFYQSRSCFSFTLPLIRLWTPKLIYTVWFVRLCR